MIRTRALPRRNPCTGKDSNFKVYPKAETLEERVQKLEEIVYGSTYPRVTTTRNADLSAESHVQRVMLTGPSSKRVDMPTLHTFVPSEDAIGSRIVRVRRSHTAQVGDRIWDGRTEACIVHCNADDIRFDKPVSLREGHAIASVPARYKIPALFYVYNLTHAPIHIVSAAAAICIQPQSSVTLSLTAAGFRTVKTT